MTLLWMKTKLLKIVYFLVKLVKGLTSCTKTAESKAQMTNCPFSSALISNFIREDNSPFSELRPIKGSSAFFKITEVFHRDDAAIDRLDRLSLFPQEQTLNRDMNLVESPERNHLIVKPLDEEYADSFEDMNLTKELVALGLPTSFSTSSEGKHLRSRAKKKNKKSRKQRECNLIEASEDKDSLQVQTEDFSDAAIPASLIIQDSVSLSAEQSKKGAVTPGETVSNGINTNCALSCQNHSTLFSESIISSNDAMAAVQSNKLDNVRNALLVDDNTEMEVSQWGMHEVEVRGVSLPLVEQPDMALDEHLKLDSACCVQSRAETYYMRANAEAESTEISPPFYILQNSEHYDSFFQSNSTASGAQNSGMGNWQPVWDTYYERYYFCNYETGETAWDPPGLGLLGDHCSRMTESKDCVTGDQAICRTNNESCDGDPGKSTDIENDAIDGTDAGDENSSKKYEEFGYNVLSKPDLLTDKVLNTETDSIESNTLSMDGIYNGEHDSTNNGFENKSENLKQLEIIDLDLTKICTQKRDEIASSIDDTQCLEQLCECILYRGTQGTSCKNEGSDSVQVIDDNEFNKPVPLRSRVLHVDTDNAESNKLFTDGICKGNSLSTNKALGNGADSLKQLEITDVDLTNSSPQKADEMPSSKDTAQFLESECFSYQEIQEACYGKKGSGSVDHLDTIESLQGLPQACGTHIWFDDDGNIMDKCTSQSIATHLHAQGSENWLEPMEEASLKDATAAVGPSSNNNIMALGDQKTKKRSRQRKLSSTDEDGEPLKKPFLPGMVEGMPSSISKYWWQRYQLFSRFDEGVKLDEEGWYSVTPEVIARHHAARSGTGIVIDCFAGVGGNAIQFAQKCHHVIAIDIDPTKIDYARHNARIYGVDDYIEFIVGDFFSLAPCLKADVVFLSPPWGGPDYSKVEYYDIQDMLKPKDGFSLFKAAQMIAPSIIMFLPRNVDLNQLAELSHLSCPPLLFEVEKNYLNGKLKAITAYYADVSLNSRPS